MDKKKSFSKTNIIITILVFSIILLMGTGYAVLTQILDVNGSGKLEIPEYRIYISDVKVLAIGQEAYASSEATYTDNEVALYSVLPSSSSSITYEITIKNTGNSNAIVDYLYTSNNNSQVKYKIDGVNATETISRLSVSKVKVTIEASENSGNATNIASSVVLNFAFLKANDSYSNSCTLNWDGSSSSEPVSTNILGTNYYQISNANEFKWFMDQINNGNTSINGMLINNICLNNASITPIASNNAYTGILDGQNRSIDGISFSRDEEIKSSNVTYNVGFFMNNNGIIKNVNFNGNYYDKQYVSTRESVLYLGGIVVNNLGIIENVSFNGNVELDVEAHVNCTARQAHTTNYIGGVSTNNSGIIRGSYNNATFNLKGSTTSATCNIYTRSSNIFAGGIVGVNVGYISDSYNKANMTINVYNENSTRTTNVTQVGGVVSNNITYESDGTNLVGKVKNSYNIGAITWNRTGTGSFEHLTDTVAINTGSLENVYLLSGSATNDDGNYTSTVVSASDLINLNVVLGTGFKKDLRNINSGYPILYWQ